MQESGDLVFWLKPAKPPTPIEALFFPLKQLS